jgi:hypothetical protein
VKEVGHGRGVVQEMKLGQVGEGVAKKLPEKIISYQYKGLLQLVLLYFRWCFHGLLASHLNFYMKITSLIY